MWALSRPPPPPAHGQRSFTSSLSQSLQRLVQDDDVLLAPFALRRRSRRARSDGITAASNTPLWGPYGDADASTPFPPSLSFAGGDGFSRTGAAGSPRPSIGGGVRQLAAPFHRQPAGAASQFPRVVFTRRQPARLLTKPPP